MDLHLNNELSALYHSHSQQARVVTEDWVGRNMYCPICGNSHLKHYESNRPVADFYCDKCSADYELKSKNGHLGKIISDGQYDKMISRINSFNNPNFFVLTHNEGIVTNFIVIPRFFFTPDIIVRRTPLASTARRAGWVGCNINIDVLPSICKVFIVKNGVIAQQEQVIKAFEHVQNLKFDNIKARGWLLDTMKVVDTIDSDTFTLKQVYAFEETLRVRHPDNNYIKDKLRQQLQMLRDKGQIEFLGNGNYRKINSETHKM